MAAWQLPTHNFSSPFQVNTLNQEVSNLAKRLHEIIDFLSSHMPMLHYAPPVSSYSHNIPMAPSPSVTASSNWQSRAPLNIATGLHLHHEAISHPARNIWGCSGMSSQGLSPTLLRSSSPLSSCLHVHCSDREGSTAHRSPWGTSQTSRTNPNSPCMSHPHARGGPSLLALSSTFGSIPVIGQAPQVALRPLSQQWPSLTLCVPPINSSHSHKSVSVQINSDPTHNKPNSQAPIHSSITPPGQSQQQQQQTAFSSLIPSVRTGYSHIQHGSLSGSRQKSPAGSSHFHHTQDIACSLLGEVTDKDWGGSLCQERTDQQITTDQIPLLDMEGMQASQ